MGGRSARRGRNTVRACPRRPSSRAITPKVIATPLTSGGNVSVTRARFTRKHRRPWGSSVANPWRSGYVCANKARRGRKKGGARRGRRPGKSGGRGSRADSAAIELRAAVFPAVDAGGVVLHVGVSQLLGSGRRRQVSRAVLVAAVGDHERVLILR